MGDIHVADQYAVSYCFICKTLKRWRKLFFWAFETCNLYNVIKNARMNNEKPMEHKKFQQKMLMKQIGVFRTQKL